MSKGEKVFIRVEGIDKSNKQVDYEDAIDFTAASIAAYIIQLETKFNISDAGITKITVGAGPTRPLKFKFSKG